MAITPARQRNAVSEGMALGMLMCGRDELLFDKIRIDLSFEGVWRAWRHNGRFPQVNTDLAKGLDGARAMTRADERKQVWILYWTEEGNRLRVATRQADWSVANPDDLEFAEGMIDGGLTSADWRALTQDFLQRLDR